MHTLPGLLRLQGGALMGLLFVLSPQDGNMSDVLMSEDDVRDVLRLMRKDLKYRQGRSQRHKRDSPHAGDANARENLGRTRLVRQLSRLLRSLS